MKRLLSILTLMSISILGCAQIDVHCHMIPDSYLEAVKALHPGRFLFCAALPLPDVQKALEEALEARLAKHGLKIEDIFSANAKILFK